MGRLAAREAQWALGLLVARRAARAVLGGDLRRDGDVPVARVNDPIAVRATPDGAACALYAAAFAELLRLLMGFEGALRHASSRATRAVPRGRGPAPPGPP